MKKLIERIRLYWAKIKELNSDDHAMTKHPNQCRFPGCTDYGTIIYACRYGKPCFCDGHSKEQSPWTRAYLEKCEYRNKFTVRPQLWGLMKQNNDSPTPPP